MKALLMLSNPPDHLVSAITVENGDMVHLILQNKYDTLQKIQKLMGKGDAFCLKENIFFERDFSKTSKMRIYHSALTAIVKEKCNINYIFINNSWKLFN